MGLDDEGLHLSWKKGGYSVSGAFVFDLCHSIPYIHHNGWASIQRLIA